MRALELYLESRLGRVSGGKETTQEQIGQLLGVSQQTVSRYYLEMRLELGPLLLPEDEEMARPPCFYRARIRKQLRGMLQT